MAFLACGSLWCGHVYGYLPEVDNITGLCTFKKELKISELTDKEDSAGSIGITDEKGRTPISFSWRNPATKKLESVCWSDKVRHNGYNPFPFDGHFYDSIMISADGTQIEIWVDGGLFIMRGKLSEIGGGDSSPSSSSASSSSSSSAWQNARAIKGVATGSSGVLGIFELKCGKEGKNGIAKVSASLTGLDGKRKIFRTQDVAVSNGTGVVSWPQSNGDALRVTISEEEFSGSGGGMSVRSAAIGGISNWNVLTFSVENVSLSVPAGYKLLDGDSLFSWSGEPVYVDRTTGRWSCRKPVVAKYVQYREGMPRPVCCTVEPSEYYLNVACDCTDGNRIGLALNYTPWQGLFRGSFKAYAVREDGKKGFKSYRVNVSGIVVDGRGYGQATCKKPAGGPWAVTVW